MKRSCSIWIIVRTCFNQLQSQMFCSPMRRYVHWCSSSKATALQPPTACPYTHCPYILVRMLIEICNKFDKIVMVHACNSQFKKVMSWWNLLHSPIMLWWNLLHLPYLRPMIESHCRGAIPQWTHHRNEVYHNRQPSIINSFFTPANCNGLIIEI